jgi:hypothetical protein
VLVCICHDEQILLLCRCFLSFVVSTYAFPVKDKISLSLCSISYFFLLAKPNISFISYFIFLW